MRKSKQFNGRYEQKETPRILIGEEILSQLKGKHKNYGGQKRKREPVELNWTKKSIFFELELLRHNLDVMHIKKIKKGKEVEDIRKKKWS